MLKELLWPEIEELLRRKDWTGLRESLSIWPAPELTDLLLSIPKPDRVLFYRTLARDLAAEVFAHLETADQDDLPRLHEAAASALATFTRAMDDDLNTSVALAALFDLVTETNARLDDLGSLPITQAEARAALDAYDRIDSVLGLLALAHREQESTVDQKLADWVELRLAERADARSARDFARADQIRDELAARGVLVEDTPAGARWSINS